MPIHGDTKTKQSIGTGSASTSSVQNVDRRDSKMCFHCDSPMAINSNNVQTGLHNGITITLIF